MENALHKIVTNEEGNMVVPISPEVRNWVNETKKDILSVTGENKKVIGRNQLCPCNSGKKYKSCCRENDILNWEKKQGWIHGD